MYEWENMSIKNGLCTNGDRDIGPRAALLVGGIDVISGPPL